MSPTTRILVPLLLPLVGVISLLRIELVHAQSADQDQSSHEQSQQIDQPDLSREKRFFNIYSNFNQQPTNEQSWSGALSGKAQGYMIQNGDTLWGVSETLFGDPQFWPKIWSLNSEAIENPHEIRPNHEVQFVPGTMGEPPSLAVSDGASSEEPSPPEKSEGPKDPLLSTELPDPTIKHPPVSAIPGSLPRWGYRKDRRQEIQMEVEKLNRNFVPANEVLNYFIADQETQAVGEITETEMNQSSAAEFQYVFVKFPKAPAENKLLVIKDSGRMKDPFSGDKGTVIQIQGQIEVLEAVNADEFLYRALVKKALGPIEVGSKLVAGELPVYSMKDEGSGESVKARIIGGPYSPERQIFGPTNLLFLGGKGLTLGQTYPIFKIQKIRNTGTNVTHNSSQIGKVKVVKIMQNFATGVVLTASEDIRVGDSTSSEEK